MSGEENRLQNVMPFKVKDVVLKRFYEKLILAYKPEIVNHSLFAMLSNNDLSTLQLMYQLFEKLDDEF
jgi:hypothetical protein